MLRHCEGVTMSSRLALKPALLNPRYLWAANQEKMAG